jgi:hypothetical protein
MIGVFSIYKWVVDIKLLSLLKATKTSSVDPVKSLCSERGLEG